MTTRTATVNSISVMIRIVVVAAAVARRSRRRRGKKGDFRCGIFGKRERDIIMNPNSSIERPFPKRAPSASTESQNQNLDQVLFLFFPFRPSAKFSSSTSATCGLFMTIPSMNSFKTLFGFLGFRVCWSSSRVRYRSFS